MPRIRLCFNHHLSPRHFSGLMSLFCAAVFAPSAVAITPLPSFHTYEEEALQTAKHQAPSLDFPLLFAASGRAGVGAQSAAQSSPSTAGSNAAAMPAQNTTPTSSVTPSANASSSTLPSQQPISTPSAASAVQSAQSPSQATTPSSQNQIGAISNPQLRGLIGTPANAAGSTGGGKIESFFQCAPIHQPSKVGSGQAGAGSTPETSQTIPHKKPGRFLWHVLDNAGVPMFSANHDAALDPSLQRYYVDPPVPDINASSGKDRHRGSKVVFETVRDTTSQNKAEAGPRASAINIQQKIPASELEGIDDSNKNDERK